MNLVGDVMCAVRGCGWNSDATPAQRIRSVGWAARLLASPRKTTPGLRYFCQNHGSCGSAYIVALMQANGIGPSFHEKKPDLDEIGVAYFDGEISDRRMKRLLHATRQDVFFEANNRLFAVTKLLRNVFPDARFLHLHRDGREVVTSMRSKPADMYWGARRRRYTSEKLCGPQELPLLDRMCTYWANYNRRILEDLEGTEYLSLKFEDLIAGRIAAVEDFMQRKFEVRTLAPVNANKPVGRDGPHSRFEDWPAGERSTFWRICADVMSAMGYAERLP